MSRSVLLLTVSVLVAAVLSACDDDGPGEHDCESTPCFRAIDCVERCGGPVLQSGCCPCPEGTFDNISCTPDSGPDAAPDAPGGEAGVDLSPDGTPPDIAAGDTAGDLQGDAPPSDALGDAAAAFPAVLEGIWLVGWSGGLNHFSWVRFTLASPAGGPAEILAGKGLNANLPLWDCSGSTTWNLAAKPDTVQIHWPSSGCVGGAKSTSYTFSSIGPPPGSFPKGAILAATVSSTKQPSPIAAYKFPAAQCDAAMASCTDPLK